MKLKTTSKPIVALVTSTLLALTAATHSFAQLTNGLIAYWPLDQFGRSVVTARDLV